MKSIPKWAVASGIVVILVLAWLLWPSSGVPLQFDSAAIAAAETRMWKAYYGKDPKGLFNELTTTLQEQFGLSGWRSKQVAMHLAAGASRFAGMREHYESVLPDVEKAYAIVKKCTGADYDPAEAARAELAWWVARRTPGKNSVEQVGQSVAHLYEVLYGKTNPQIERAGYLRAQAARVRDKTSDWPQVEEILGESYAELVVGLEVPEDQ